MIGPSETAMLAEAWKSHSLPVLISKVTDVAQAVCARRDLPNCKHYSVQLSAFYTEAKRVRSDRREKKISLHQQHEILATSWNSLIGHGVVEKIMTELGGNDDKKGPNDEEKGGGNYKADQQNNQVTPEGGLGDGDGEDDSLERWFSWPGTGTG
jgi:hypothetical protein